MVPHYSTSIERKARERELRRNEIIQSAKEIFLKKSYMFTTLEEIANKAGFSKSAVYRYFNSKDEILVAIVEDSLVSLINFLKETLKSGKNFMDSLELILDKILQTHEDVGWIYRLIHGGKYEVDFENTKANNLLCTYREKVIPKLEELIGILTSLMSKGMDEKILRIDIHPFRHALALFGIIQAFSFACKLNLNSLPNELINHKKTIISLFLNGSIYKKDGLQEK